MSWFLAGNFQFGFNFNEKKNGKKKGENSTINHMWSSLQVEFRLIVVVSNLSMYIVYAIRIKANFFFDFRSVIVALL